MLRSAERGRLVREPSALGCAPYSSLARGLGEDFTPLFSSIVDGVRYNATHRAIAEAVVVAWAAREAAQGPGGGHAATHWCIGRLVIY